MKNHYEPCRELDECNWLIEEYWNTQRFKECFEGHLKLAQETHYPLAECQVGYFYLNGIGTERNVGEGIRWTRLAALHGDHDAQCNLAELYEEGILLEKDDAKPRTDGSAEENAKTGE